jgi:quercetin dioxygenase-like cupin family protein
MAVPPVALSPHEATPVRLCWGDVVVPVVPSALTAGAFACVRVTGEPAVARPAYVDHAADEVVHVLSGSFALTSGDDDPIPLEAGSVVWVPRGRPRRLDVAGRHTGTALIIATPGEPLDDLLAALREGTTDAATLARCGIELVEP